MLLREISAASSLKRFHNFSVTGADGQGGRNPRSLRHPEARRAAGARVCCSPSPRPHSALPCDLIHRQSRCKGCTVPPTMWQMHLQPRTHVFVTAPATARIIAIPDVCDLAEHLPIGRPDLHPLVDASDHAVGRHSTPRFTASGRARCSAVAPCLVSLCPEAFAQPGLALHRRFPDPADVPDQHVRTSASSRPRRVPMRTSQLRV